VDVGGSIPSPPTNSLCRDRQILVGTTALADYISGPIDYLKIDIEGSEREVLPSIRDRLHLVRDAAIEFHGSGRQARQEEDGLVELLQDSGFSVSVIDDQGCSARVRRRSQIDS
jgi:hypothetical protein